MNPMWRARLGNAGRATQGVATRAFLCLAAVLLVRVALAARADEVRPGRVGRVAEVAGALYLAPEERATEWAAVERNYPITSGDNLWVDGDGRAEIDYGGGQFRLAGGTSMHVARLDDRALLLFVAQGRLIVHVRALDPGELVQVDTPMTQVQFTQPGLYRLDVAPDTQAVSLIVREGDATLWLAGMAQQVRPGQTVLVRNPAVAEFRNGVGVDGFDTWGADRDRYYAGSRSADYVSPEMVGGADLGNYGQWSADPDYGAVWYPTSVAPDWAPYSDGYWTSLGGWGAVWVDAAPWGYAPFHYGRWARVRGRWAWCPGAYVARPFWAPALVAWYGGAQWSYSARFGSPAYGWVALGWAEPYTPAWRRCSDRCWTAYNRPYAVKLPERPRTPPAQYVNAAVPGAIVAVPGAALVGAKPVAINRLRLPADTLAGAPLLAAPPPATPDPGRGSRARRIAGLPVPASSIRTAMKTGSAGSPVAAAPAPGRTAMPRAQSGRSSSARWITRPGNPRVEWLRPPRLRRMPGGASSALRRPVR